MAVRISSTGCSIRELQTPEINHKLNLAIVRSNEICRGKALWECFDSEVMLLLDRERETWVKGIHAG